MHVLEAGQPRRRAAGDRAHRRLRRRPRLPGAQHRLSRGRPTSTSRRWSSAGSTAAPSIRRRRPRAPGRRPPPAPARPLLGTLRAPIGSLAGEGGARRVLRPGRLPCPCPPCWPRASAPPRRRCGAREWARPHWSDSSVPSSPGVRARERPRDVQPLPRPALAQLRARRHRPARARHAGGRRAAGRATRPRSACTSGTAARSVVSRRGGDRRRDAAEPTPSSWPPTRRPPPACCPAVDASAPRSVTTHFHVLPASPWSSPLIVLGQPGGRLVNTVVLTDAQPRYSPDGRALVASSTLAAERARPTSARRWPGRTTCRRPTSRTSRRSPSPAPSRRRCPRCSSAAPVDLGDGVYVCGDHRDTPSIQGAMASGARAARAVLRRLRPSSSPAPESPDARLRTHDRRHQHGLRLPRPRALRLAAGPGVRPHDSSSPGRPERPRLCYLGTATGDDPARVAGVYGAFAGSAVQVSHLSLFTDADGRRHAGAPARPGRRLGRRRQRRQPARRVAGARPRRDLPRGVGGRRRPRRGLGRLAVLARRRHHRLLRPRPAAGHERPRASSRRPTACTTTPRSSAVRCTTGWSPTARCPPGTPPTTASGWSTAARSWSRPWPTGPTWRPTGWSAAPTARRSRRASSRAASLTRATLEP